MLSTRCWTAPGSVPRLLLFFTILTVCAFVSEAATPQVLISEIMYHPPGTNDLEQWFELSNSGTKTVDLSAWQVTKGVHFLFPAGTVLGPGAYLVVAADGPTFRASHPTVTNFVAGWTGKLNHNLEISDASGNVINSVQFYSEGDWATRLLGPVQYNHQGWIWRTRADGEGASVELVNPRLPNSYAHNWAPNADGASTPGRANSVASADAAPFIANVTHWPVIPNANTSVTITARVVDEALSGTSVVLHWRRDGTATFASTTLADDGAHSDGVVGDGVYGATIPPQPDHTVIEFYLTASDAAGHTRQYPNFIPPANSTRTANLLYQVDSAAAASPQPIYRIIMTESERAELQALGRGCPDSDSDAEMNATWITTDGVLTSGTTTQLRYNAGVRNRGHGTRQSDPHNYHINIPEDRPWKNQTGINLNSQHAHSQVIGSAVVRAAGIAMPDSRAVQLRVNSTNVMALSLPDLNSFGSYAANEQYDSDFIRRTFPVDPGGNSYRGIRDQALCDGSLSGTADLKWHGTNWSVAAYTNAYFKQNNFAENDWSDLIRLLSVLNVTNGTTEATYVQDVQSTLDVPEWMRYMAVNTLLDNQETALANGVGDDFALYYGRIDPRFQALPYDLDSVLGRGERGVSRQNGIFRMTNLPAMDRFMKTPQFAPIYYAQLKALAETVFLPGRMNALIDQLLGNFVPPDARSLMKSFNESHRAYVLAQIPAGLSATVNLPLVSGYFQTVTNRVTIAGTADAIRTRTVFVNGQPAERTAWTASWAATNQLFPGVNRLTIRAIDAEGAEIARTNLDVWFDRGATQPVTTSVTQDTHWPADSGPYLVTSTLTIGRGATLDIDPGTSIYLASGADIVIADGGRLLAVGTEAAPIRFSRTPGSTATWGGIQVNGSAGSPETRLVHCFIEGNGSVAIHSSAGTLLLDHLDFGSTDKQYVSLDASSFVVSHCYFPTPTAGFEPAHGTGGIKQGGHGIFFRNFFGAPNGYNDVVDFTGGQRGGPIVYFVDNVFIGSGDDGLDLDGTDAWVERNIFLHIHQNGAPDSSSAISGGSDGANTSEVTIIGNLIFDCDDAVTAKQGNFFSLLNNTIVHTTRAGGGDIGSGAVNVRDTTPSFTTFARGVYLEGNIITDAEELVRNYDPAETTVTFINNLLPFAWSGPGNDNVVGDPLLQHVPTLPETEFTSWEQAQVLRDWFKPVPGSPAIGTGPNGRDKGAAVPAGVYISGQPSGITTNRTAILNVGVNRKGFGMPLSGWPLGSGYLSYRWRLDGNAWSDEQPLDQSIILTNLSTGVHTVEVSGKSDAAIFQDDPLLGDSATTTRVTWEVNPSATVPTFFPVRLSEILASNSRLAMGSSTHSDLVELFNSSTNQVDLGGFRLSKASNSPPFFLFSAGTIILPGSYLVLNADSAVTNAGLHLGFNLGASGDALYFSDPQGRVVDSVVFGNQVPDLSIGRSFEGDWTLCTPTFGAANLPVALAAPDGLRINEWLANVEFAAADNFVEIYNPATNAVALGGLFLSDAAGNPDRYLIPPLSFVGARGFATFAADGKAAPGHLSFKLSADVGQIALSSPDRSTIDVVSYGPQTTDVSEGRSPDGSDLIRFFPQPTPGAPNPAPEGGGYQTNIVRTALTVVSFTNSWRYQATGSFPGATWFDPLFTDASWNVGNAPFYHGNDAARLPIRPTTQLPFTNPEQSAFYFRSHFVWHGETNGPSLNLTALIDDGAVIYLNGNEVLRRNMPAGPIAYSTHASGTVSDAAFSGPFNAPAIGLIDGDNLIAAEVHQANLTSSDIAFALNVDVGTSVTNISVASVAVPVVLNELVANPAANQSDWIELYNPSTNRVDLANVTVTDNVESPQRWSFAPGSFIESGAFLILYCDPTAPVSTNNTGFGLEPDGGTVFLFDSAERGGALLDAVRYGIQVAGASIARAPDGAGDWELATPTPGAANHASATGLSATLKINEWLASASVGNDWFELYNSTASPVALGGLLLTDDLTDRAKFRLPPLSFIGSGPNAFLRFEADSSPDKGARHVDFNLSAKGEAIGLYDTDGAPIDSVVFGPQSDDISQGRQADGSDNFVVFPVPTPGRSNNIQSGDSDSDGLPDDWERSYFGNLSRDGKADFDGDGFSDLQEFVAGTDPTNPADRLQLRGLGVDGGAFLVDLFVIAGKSYRIEFSDTLTLATWNPLRELAPASSGLVTIRDESYASSTHRFYRVRVE